MRKRSPIYGDDESSAGNLIRPQPVGNASTNAFTGGQQTGNGFYQPAQVRTQGMPSQQPSFTNLNPVGASATNPRDQLYHDRIEAMTTDNQSLQRRLNQVSLELERIYREKDEVKRNFDKVESEVEHMNRLVNTKDNVDAQNIVLKDEVERYKLDNVELDRTLKNEEIERA